jgi:hypothetical protein
MNIRDLLLLVNKLQLGRNLLEILLLLLFVLLDDSTLLRLIRLPFPRPRDVPSLP